MRKLAYLPIAVLIVVGSLLSIAAIKNPVAQAAPADSSNMCPQECPECPGGWVTIEESVWVDPVPAVTHMEHRTKKSHGGWNDWEMGACPWPGPSAWCQEREVIDVPEIPGHCTDPVCYEPCSILGNPVYGEWTEWAVNPENEAQLMRSRTVTNPDSMNSGLVCGSDVEYEYKDRLPCEWPTAEWADDPLCVPPELEVSWKTGADCSGWYAKLYIDDELVGEESGEWAGEDYVTVTIEDRESPPIDNPWKDPDECTVPPPPPPVEEIPPTGDGIGLMDVVLPIFAGGGLSSVGLYGLYLLKKRRQDE
jgi:hypothetical protein